MVITLLLISMDSEQNFNCEKKSNQTVLIDLMSKSISAHKSCGSIDDIVI